MNKKYYSWDDLKRRAYVNNRMATLILEIDRWLLVDDYLPATDVVGTMALEKELQVSNDFMQLTEWPNLIVWPFPDTKKKKEYEETIIDAINSLMMFNLSEKDFYSNYYREEHEKTIGLSLHQLGMQLFRYEKCADIQVGGYRWYGYAIDRPFDRFKDKWYWKERATDPFVFTHLISGVTMVMLKKNFDNTLSIDPREFPNSWRQSLREMGGQYIRTMGRLSMMRKIRRLCELIQRNPI